MIPHVYRTGQESSDSCPFSLTIKIFESIFIVGIRRQQHITINRRGCISMQGYKKRSVAPLNGALQEGVVKDGRYEIFIQSSGIAGKDWTEVLKKKGFPVEPSAKSVLCSPGFKITSGERNIIVIFNFSAFQEAIKEPDFKKNYGSTDRRNGLLSSLQA